MRVRMIGIVAALAISSTATAEPGESWVEGTLQDRAYVIRADWNAVADAVASTGNVAAAMQIEEALIAVPDANLERLYGDVDVNPLIEAFTANGNDLIAADEAMEEMASLRENIACVGGGYPTTSLCSGSTRFPANSGAAALLAIMSAKDALDIAKGVWSVISRACEQDVAGGNSSLACIPADAVLAAAELTLGVAEDTFGVISFCNRAIDATEIEGSYELLKLLRNEVKLLTELVETIEERQQYMMQAQEEMMAALYSRLR